MDFEKRRERQKKLREKRQRWRIEKDPRKRQIMDLEIKIEEYKLKIDRLKYH